jgi:alanyl-tRNA synthetase
MLGNWSFGDYFKAESIPWGWELSTEGFGMDPERIWVTSSAATRSSGSARRGGDRDLARVGVRTSGSSARPRGQLLAGRPDRPLRPCSELYLDRGDEFGAEDDRPGDDTERFLEFWNHVFMSYDLAEDGSLTELPMRNIDTGMGLDRMAAILQDVPRSMRPTTSGR